MAERKILSRRKRPDPLTPSERAEYNALSHRRFNKTSSTLNSNPEDQPLSVADRNRLDQLGEKIETATLPAQWWLKPENRRGS